MFIKRTHSLRKLLRKTHCQPTLAWSPKTWREADSTRTLSPKKLTKVLTSSQPTHTARSLLRETFYPLLRGLHSSPCHLGNGYWLILLSWLLKPMTVPARGQFATLDIVAVLTDYMR